MGFSSQPVEAQPFSLTQITNTTAGASLNLFPSINAAGTRIAFQSNRDLTPGSPGNADGNGEIFLFDTTTSTFTQITDATGGTFDNSISINDAGTRIAFQSDRDLTPGSPGNADGNVELFLAGEATAPATVSVPTLSEWAQLAMVAGLVLGGLLAFTAADLSTPPSDPDGSAPPSLRRLRQPSVTGCRGRCCSIRAREICGDCG